MEFNDDLYAQRRVSVSVVICTRNRGDKITAAVKSILMNNYPGFELIIFDQSTNDATQVALESFAGDKRLRYIRSKTVGTGLARALSLELVCSDIVLMTDDDCEVAGDWIECMTRIHVENPYVAMAFCDVKPGPFDPENGFIPITLAQRSMLINSLRTWCKLGAASIALGAGMSMRRSLIRDIGGFDTCLGPGTSLRSAEETDLAIRALLKHFAVMRTTETSVVHFGFRTMAEGRVLMRNHSLGIAAVHTKLLRCGYWRVILVMLFEIWRTIVLPIFVNLMHAKVPPVLGRTIYMARGFVLAWTMPLDRRRGVFKCIDFRRENVKMGQIA